MEQSEPKQIQIEFCDEQRRVSKREKKSKKIKKIDKMVNLIRTQQCSWGAIRHDKLVHVTLPFF